MTVSQKNQNWFRLSLIIVSLLLSGFLFNFTLTAALAQEEDQTTAQEENPFGPDVVTATTTVNLRLREGPGTQHPTITTLPYGTVVGFTGFTDETGDWVQVDSGDDSIGWVAAQFLSNVPTGLQVPSTDAPADDPVTEESEVVFDPDVVTATTTVNLRLREGPGTEHPIITTLPHGTVVGFTGLTDESGDWVQVDSGDDSIGWVWAEFLSSVPTELEAASADVPADEPVTEESEAGFSSDVVTATTTVHLRLREGAGVEHEIIDVLPPGTVVGFTGFTDASGGWVQVDTLDGPVGWVWAEFLSNVPTDLEVWVADS